MAYADQRAAAAGEFLDRMVAGERANVAERGAGDGIAVAALSEAFDRLLTAPGAMSDALALAIRKLATR